MGDAAEGHGDLHSHKRWQNVPSRWSRHQHLVATATAQEAAEEETCSCQQTPCHAATTTFLKGGGSRTQTPHTAWHAHEKQLSREISSHSHPFSQASI